MNGNLCPECEGLGYVEGETINPGNFYDPPEWDFSTCPVCGGEGTIDTIPSEEEAA